MGEVGGLASGLSIKLMTKSNGKDGDAFGTNSRTRQIRTKHFDHRNAPDAGVTTGETAPFSAMDTWSSAGTLYSRADLQTVSITRTGDDRTKGHHRSPRRGTQGRQASPPYIYGTDLCPSDPQGNL